MTDQSNPFAALSDLRVGSASYAYYSLKKLAARGFAAISRLPVSIRVLLENALRNIDGYRVTEDHVRILAQWNGGTDPAEIPFLPARVVLQDFTGVPAVVDLAAMRSAMARLGGTLIQQ